MQLTSPDHLQYYQEYAENRPKHHHSFQKTDTHTLNGLVLGSRSQTILDYGSGHGNQYSQYQLNDKFNIKSENITCFDIGIPEYSNLPEGKFDGVICMDVLEHIPEDYLDTNLKIIFDKATKFVYFAIFCGKARNTLPNGENAHCTVRKPSWWRERISGLNVNNIPVAYSYRIPQDPHEDVLKIHPDNRTEVWEGPEKNKTTGWGLPQR